MSSKQANRWKVEQIERELEQFVNPREADVLKRMEALEREKGRDWDGAPSSYDYYVKLFRQCWAASSPLLRDTANLTLDGIFAEDPHNATRLETLRVLNKLPYGSVQISDGKFRIDAEEHSRPVFCVDLTGIGVRANPRDYIDQLALALITARRRLGVCLAEGCKHPYFIARYPRQHYCSDECREVGRRTTNNRWARMHYEKARPDEFGTRAKKRAQREGK